MGGGSAVTAEAELLLRACVPTALIADLQHSTAHNTAAEATMSNKKHRENSRRKALSENRGLTLRLGDG